MPQGLHPPIFSEADGLEHKPDEMVLCGPPGCGKTRAVLEHFLIPAVERWPAYAVMGCSFTRAAAQEMRNRLAERSSALTDSALKAVCSTIHAEGFRLCRIAGMKTLWKGDKSVAAAEEEADFAGWQALQEERSEQREEAERLWSVARHLRPDDLVLRPAAYSLDQASSLLSRATLRSSIRSRYSLDELAAEVLVYEADKSADGAIDFVDMLAFALCLPFPDRELLIVDEAQDLSPLQIALVRRWASRSRRLCWVGDPDQGIYSFSGADGSALTELMRSDQVRTRRLAQSYRVPKAAHEEARELILRNKRRIDAPYSPAPREGTIVSCTSPEKALSEALTREGSVFILGRSARALDDYAQMMVEGGEPFSRERGGSSPLRKGAIIVVLVALHDLLSRLAITAAAAYALVDSFKARPKGRFDGTKKAALETLKQLGEKEEWISRRDMERAGVVLEPILATGTLEGALEVLGIREESEPLLRIARRHGIGALTQKPRVVLTTMHSSKGREAETVVVDLFAPVPSRMARQAGDVAAVEDERKVLYVALTRTLDTLILRHHHTGEEDLSCLLR